MFNRITFGGSFSKFFEENIYDDLHKREFIMLFILVLFTVILGVYPSLILNGITLFCNNGLIYYV